MGHYRIQDRHLQGAIAAGREYIFGYPELPATIAAETAAAAVGQSWSASSCGEQLFLFMAPRWPDAADLRRYGRPRTLL